MKVGDLVKIKSPFGIHPDEHGLILQLSKTGHDTLSAQVLFNDTGKPCWFDTKRLVVISEAR